MSKPFASVLRVCSSMPDRCPLAALRASQRVGQLVTAPLFRLGLGTGIEAATGAGSLSKGQVL
jgi:hypothetical protein